MKAEATFLAQLSDSLRAVFLAAKWLENRGLRPRVVPTQVRSDADQRMAFQDSGDIEITLRVEVKHRSLAFSSRQDFPFDSVIVDEVYKIDGRPRNLYGYMIFDDLCRTLCLIPGHTRRHW